jgi:hypothetical protein
VQSTDAGALRDGSAELISFSGVRQRLGSRGPVRARELCDPKQQLLRMQSVLSNLGVSTGIRGGPEVAEAFVSWHVLNNLYGRDEQHNPGPFLASTGAISALRSG